MKYYLRSLKERIKVQKKYKCLLDRIRKELQNIKYARVSKSDTERLKIIILDMDAVSDEVLAERLLSYQDFLTDFFERYHYHAISRYVDFNQGLDARLFSEAKAEKMAELAIRPCRIAFDNLKTKDDYLLAMENAVKYGITNFSNYLLYNYDESPESLWTRLQINVHFCKKHINDGISLFSFPMKYASITHINREFIGKEWHKKYLRALNIILNVTSGVVPKEEEFFYRAYGKNISEFIEILMMPDDFIRFRDYFEEMGFSCIWKRFYLNLSDSQREILVDILDRMVDEPEILDYHYEAEIDSVLRFYSIRKKKVEKNRLYYKNLLSKMERELTNCT